MGVDHIELGVAGTRQFRRLVQDPVIEIFVLTVAVKRVDGGNDPARQVVMYLADIMQRHRAFAQQVDVQGVNIRRDSSDSYSRALISKAIGCSLI